MPTAVTSSALFATSAATWVPHSNWNPWSVTSTTLDAALVTTQTDTPKSAAMTIVAAVARQPRNRRARSILICRAADSVHVNTASTAMADDSTLRIAVKSHASSDATDTAATRVAAITPTQQRITIFVSVKKW